MIDLLVADGWAVTGVARSEETLAGVTAAGARAVQGDITDQASVRAVLEEAAAAQGGVDLVVNAAAAYGGDRSGPFGGGPISGAPPEAFDSWAAAPARSAFAFLSATGAFLVAQGKAGDGDPGDRRLVAPRGCRPRPLGCGRIRRQGDHAGGGARAARARHPRRAADHRRGHPAALGRRSRERGRGRPA